ncbi:MAG: oxidoreductase [Glycomyces artemisiae]|uniref:Oxidoreductase n=1 Tax=Glycomyces artemisiae TaxID=1076443 RepID=A0A850CBA7_9ACTN|nr:oxidoreductase [Glycomyces artemisiae]
MPADTTPDTRPLLGAAARRALTASHVVLSVVWLAYMAFVLALCVWVLVSPEPGTADAAWAVAGMFNGLGTGAISFAVLGTGLVLAASGGLLRHWWTAAKLAAAVGVIAGGLAVLRPSLTALAAGAGTGADQAALTAGTALGTISLGFAVAVSYLRPWGRIGRLRAERPVADGRIEVRVRRVVPVAAKVHAIELVGLTGRLLPPFEPGAHLEVELPSGTVRHYSLCSYAGDRLLYRIAVLREDAGRGGSREAHRLREGDRIRISPPRNQFPLGLHSGYLFIAGGIGITPIMPMILQVERSRLPWRLVYTGRDRSTMAFADQLATTWPGNVVLYPTSKYGRPDYVAELAGLPAPTGVYACGPVPLMDALADIVRRVAPQLELHTEKFAAPAGPAPFPLFAKRSGVEVTVGTDRTALAALVGAGVEVPSSCENGVCGTCRLRVVEGSPEHPGRVSGALAPDGAVLFYPCVGRARGRLVVDA